MHGKTGKAYLMAAGVEIKAGMLVGHSGGHLMRPMEPTFSFFGYAKEDKTSTAVGEMLPNKSAENVIVLYKFEPQEFKITPGETLHPGLDVFIGASRCSITKMQ